MQKDKYLWLWNSPKLRELATINLKRYFATLYKLVIEDDKEYDAITLGGNTGLIMGQFTQMFYEKIGIQTPPMFKFPNARSSDSNSKSTAVQSAKDQARELSIKTLKNILFEDDEIGKGTTAHFCLKVLIDSELCNNLIDYDIVAENRNFNPIGYPKYVNVRLYPFAHGLDGFYNLIIYSLPFEIEKQLKSITNSVKTILLILFGLPSRNKDRDNQVFNFELNKKAQKKVTNLDLLMKETLSIYYSIIDEAIEEYKAGEIDLEDSTYIDKILNS